MVETVGNFLSGWGIGTSAVLIVPAFLFVITVVVFFHELGHFVAARVPLKMELAVRACPLVGNPSRWVLSW